MTKPDEKIVPTQYIGSKKDFEYFVLLEDLTEAKKLFLVACNRLLNINQWDETSDGPSARFMLTDGKGNEVRRLAQKGDYFKIDIPGPGSNDGKGYDWVAIENIEVFHNENDVEESVSIRVRPASNPKEPVENVAHFFTADATSTFVVSRHENEVSAAIHGRNEIPNTKTDNTVDKIRNAVIATSAIIGLSNVQWRNLARGLIKPLPE
jgi:hypothetical protein